MLNYEDKQKRRHLKFLTSNSELVITKFNGALNSSDICILFDRRHHINGRKNTIARILWKRYISFSLTANVSASLPFLHQFK